MDSWTLLTVKIPVGGLTPFPSDINSQENWAEQVVFSPLTMATLGQGSAADTAAQLQAKYDAAYKGMGAKITGEYTQGMINSGARRLSCRLHVVSIVHHVQALTVCCRCCLAVLCCLLQTPCGCSHRTMPARSLLA